MPFCFQECAAFLALAPNPFLFLMWREAYVTIPEAAGSVSQILSVLLTECYEALNNKKKFLMEWRKQHVKVCMYYMCNSHKGKGREAQWVYLFVCAKEHTVIHFTGFSSWPEPAERYYLFVCVCVLCVWVCAHTHTHVPRHGHATAHVLGVIGQPGVSLFSFQHVSSGNWTRVLRLGGRHLCLPSQLADLERDFLKTALLPDEIPNTELILSVSCVAFC